MSSSLYKATTRLRRATDFADRPSDQTTDLSAIGQACRGELKDLPPLAPREHEKCGPSSANAAKPMHKAPNRLPHGTESPQSYFACFECRKISDAAMGDWRLVLYSPRQERTPRNRGVRSPRPIGM